MAVTIVSGSGKPRNSLGRGLAALALAPALVILPLAIILPLLSRLGPERGDATISLHSQVQGLEFIALGLGVPTLVLGLPTWLLLRHASRESGWAYVLAGLLEGLLCAVHFGYSGALRLDQALAFCLLSMSGGGIAFAFWRITQCKEG